jgi:hypothetical protein
MIFPDDAFLTVCEGVPFLRAGEDLRVPGKR